MSKAPDTRNKLDSNKGLKKQAKKSFKEVKEEFHGSRVKSTPKETKGQAFKKAMGYSKSLKRAMRKAGTADLYTYRIARKARKKVEKLIRQKKHAASTAYKRTNGKKKGSKGSKPAPKVASK